MSSVVQLSMMTSRGVVVKSRGVVVTSRGVVMTSRGFVMTTRGVVVDKSNQIYPKIVRFLIVRLGSLALLIYLIITECVFIVCGKFPCSLIKKTVRVTGLVFSVKYRYNPDEAKW